MRASDFKMIYYMGLANEKKPLQKVETISNRLQHSTRWKETVPVDMISPLSLWWQTKFWSFEACQYVSKLE